MKVVCVVLFIAVLISVLTSGCSTLDTMLGLQPTAKRSVSTVGDHTSSLVKPSQTARMSTIYGRIAGTSEHPKTVTVTTTMGQREVFEISEETQIKKGGQSLSLQELEKGKSVTVKYTSQTGGKLLASAIEVSTGSSKGNWSSCSCGYSCPCPPSRGCRVFR